MIVEVARRACRSALCTGVMTSRRVSVLIAAAFSVSAQATAVDPHGLAVAVARAQIVTGVRIRQDTPLPRRETSDAVKPRERPCPERDQAPCRLLVTDIP